MLTREDLRTYVQIGYLRAASKGDMREVEGQRHRCRTTHMQQSIRDGRGIIARARDTCKLHGRAIREVDEGQRREKRMKNTTIK